MSSAENWLRKLQSLKLDRAKGNPAPHKPLLLLVLLDIAGEGEVAADAFPLTPELSFKFSTYWRVVAHRRSQRPTVRFPFHHLQTDGLWTALNDGLQPSAHRSLTRFARFDTEFTALLADPSWRDQARRVLIKTYFPPDEQLALFELLGMSEEAESQPAEGSAPQLEEVRKRGRDARFRLGVIAAYDYTCALTGYRLLTIDAGTIVDAAHIHQFAKSQNNDLPNGLALCKNAHWMFDNGLWSVADDFTVLVASEHFAESGTDLKLLAGYRGGQIRLPTEERYWPAPKHLAWHRKHRFLGSPVAAR